MLCDSEWKLSVELFVPSEKQIFKNDETMIDIGHKDIKSTKYLATFRL